MEGSQLQAAGLLERIEDKTAREQRIDLLQQLLADGFSVDELREATSSGRLALLPVTARPR